MTQMYRRMVVPVSGSPGDQKAIDLAERIGEPGRKSIILVYVVEVAQSMPLDAELPAEVERGELALAASERMANEASSQGQTQIATDILQSRTAGSAIVDEAIEQGADAIVIASAIQMKHGRASTGDTVDYVLKNAPCDVILVRYVS